MDNTMTEEIHRKAVACTLWSTWLRYAMLNRTKGQR